MSLTVSQAMMLLKEHQLLVQSYDISEDMQFQKLAYDSRKVEAKTLFFCKGAFVLDYLEMAKKQGASAYVAQTYYPDVALPALIVSDVQKALAVLSAAFYDYPQNKLAIIAITGTKGKTTTGYLAYNILKEATKSKTALFSTIDRIVGPEKKDCFKSDLTTPESLDLFHDMYQAVANGMTHLVMEVSSQAYKKNRVYGLKYDVGIFLNISSDHIGANEHPDFADYLYCKEQLLRNARKCIINAQSAYFDELYDVAKSSCGADNVYSFARKGVQQKVDVLFSGALENLSHSQLEVQSISSKAKSLTQLDGSYDLSVPGDYNESNALAALLATNLLIADNNAAKKALANTHIPGRMEIIASQSHGTVYVDYAHNYASLKALLVFLKQQNPNALITVVLSSAGNKGLSRRADLGKALNEEAMKVILTTDDPGFEDPHDINQEIRAQIITENIEISEILDRCLAIKQAIQTSKAGDVIVLAGKGEDPYQKIKGEDVFYAGDVKVAKDIIEELEK
ncbi:UDP-N-acetylmuramoyl-L-alanyl-D-glutamate--2,6-diaminopimelate ligase [Ligilactobacillus sp. Marseille-Q7487]|uniref:UDP-N-acetylmuramoyl-L-alanyl-D-glutamate--2, 6-diaminopimelate ligase n=1 Tax=Ligilactobacillus sp. Marseille-Q7487 TaxID=3022128 RepID=UPI0024A9AFE0|nr:UDP-N-acetylmuramoyl-L-alanyl-D-glutamate--2,6-diaminopimelate ligase [Ligilactobacillus sp. Marseille-Q7487]